MAQRVRRADACVTRVRCLCVRRGRIPPQKKNKRFRAAEHEKSVRAGEVFFVYTFEWGYVYRVFCGPKAYCTDAGMFTALYLF